VLDEERIQCAQVLIARLLSAAAARDEALTVSLRGEFDELVP